jgi:hypothetical protein
MDHLQHLHSAATYRTVRFKEILNISCSLVNTCNVKCDWNKQFIATSLKGMAGLCGLFPIALKVGKMLNRTRLCINIYIYIYEYAHKIEDLT